MDQLEVKKSMNVELNLRSRWLGREIEYRDCLPLSKSTQCFRGRIVQLVPYAYAMVEATYVTSFPVNHYDVTLWNPVELEWFRKRDHKTVYKKAGNKYAWKPIEKKIHVVRFNGKRWKKINSSQEYINNLLSLKERYYEECK